MTQGWDKISSGAALHGKESNLFLQERHWYFIGCKDTSSLLAELAIKLPSAPKAMPTPMDAPFAPFVPKTLKSFLPHLGQVRL